MTYDINDISIIIPNWNGRELLEKHLPIVLSLTKGAEVIVVDDCSTDSSLEYLESLDKHVIVVEQKEHKGFSSTVNNGVRASTRPLLLLLNTDIEPEKGFLRAVFPHFQDPLVFAVGLMDKSVEGETITLRGRGTSSFQRGMYVHSKGEVSHSSTAWVSCGSGVFSKEIWNRIGGLDELFNPFYWEDIDLSYRARKAGYRLIFEPNSYVLHKHDQGAIKSSTQPEEIQKIAFRNQLFFIWKNITDVRLMSMHLVLLPYHIIRPLLGGNSMFLLGFIAAFAQLYRCIRKRKEVQKVWKLSDSEIITVA